MPDETPLERALIELVRRSCAAPARLTTADLEPVRAAAGDGALDYALVLSAFHFINRIADLLHVDSEALPERLRRFEFLRRLSVRVASRLMARMDLQNRRFDASYDETVAAIRPALVRATGRDPGDAFRPVAARPKLVEALRLALEERDERSSLGRDTLARIHRVVEEALPVTRADSEGLHRRPDDPVEAFAFVGTRYAYRATEDLIARLRRQGYDDLGILDLATAVADANQWARMWRLTGLAPDIFSLAPPAPAPVQVTAGGA